MKIRRNPLLYVREQAFMNGICVDCLVEPSELRRAKCSHCRYVERVADAERRAVSPMTDCLALVPTPDGTVRICGRYLMPSYPAVFCPGCLADSVLTAAVTYAAECLVTGLHTSSVEALLADAGMSAELIYAEDGPTLARFPRRRRVDPAALVREAS